MKQSSIEEALHVLFNVTAEPSKALKLGVLTHYLRSADSTSEAYRVLCTILSFQFDELWSTPQPRFSLVEYEEFEKPIAKFFYDQSLANFKGLPFVMQHVIHFMGGPETLGLRLRDIGTLDFQYMNPYSTILANSEAVPISGSYQCCICGIKHTNDLCVDCTEMLEKHAEYRSEDFLLTLSVNNTLPVLTVDYGVFDTTIMHYKVQRVGLNTFKYTLKPNNTQLLLPIEEYQTKIM